MATAAAVGIVRELSQSMVKKLRGEDSNLRCQDQNLECYRYTTPDRNLSLGVRLVDSRYRYSGKQIHERNQHHVVRQRPAARIE